MVRRNGWDGDKRKYIRVESGVPHNPPPSTDRGWRRNRPMHQKKKGE